MRRFFYHFNKPQHKMTVHWGGKCHLVDNVKCDVPCETKWNKRQPMLVMQGWATHLHLDQITGVATIS